MKRITQSLVFLVLAGLCIPGCGKQEKVTPEVEEKIEAVEAADVVAEPGDLPKLEIDIEEKTVTGKGVICLEKGILEYLIVAKGGKEYESIIAMDVTPSALHTAFLMIGAVSGVIEEEFRGDGKGDEEGVGEKKAKASEFEVFFEWEDGDKKVKVPAGDLLYDRKAGEKATGLVWAFTGSYFTKDMDGREVYLADVAMTIAAIWYDGSSLLNLAEASENPYRGDDFGFELNGKVVPEKNTPVTIIFKLR